MGGALAAEGREIPKRRLTTRERRVLEVNRITLNAAGCERVRTLAAHLEESDRVLVQAVYRDGLSPAMIARVRGGSEARVRRRVARVVTRMLTPAFALVASQGHAWPRVRWLVAQACVLHGCGLREAARRAGVSVHAARREMGHVRAVVEAVGMMRAVG